MLCDVGDLNAFEYFASAINKHWNKARCATEAFGTTCAVHTEDSVGWWLSSGRGPTYFSFLSISPYTIKPDHLLSHIRQREE